MIPTSTQNTMSIPGALGPMNPKSAHVSGGSQMMSSDPPEFRQCGPVQLPLHSHVAGLRLAEHVPRDLPPQDWGNVTLVGAVTEHVPPPFWIGFSGCT